MTPRAFPRRSAVPPTADPRGSRRTRRLLPGTRGSARSSSLAAAVAMGLGVSLLGAAPAGATNATGVASVASLASAAGPVPHARAGVTRIANAAYDRGPQLRRGQVKQARIAKGSVRMKKVSGTRRALGRRWDKGVWTSPWTTTAFSFDELIPSWQATTPGESWIDVRVRVRGVDGTVGSWDTVARWTSGSAIPRTTLKAQEDDLARMAVDTVKVTHPGGANAYQLRVQLLRRKGTNAQPTLDRIGAVTSRVVGGRATSRPGAAAGTVLDVPAYSQMTHRGHYPQWGNGGEAWCSPTSTAMVLEYYDANPAEAHGFGRGHADGVVDWTASQVFDHGYRGTGNWAFNTAHAGRFLPRTRVTRLRDLRAAERFITAGTPLVLSVAFRSGELRNSPIRSTNGHLMVLVGFDARGNVVVNDPAAPSNGTVRRTYDRAEFERAWLGGSGGVTYVLED